MQCPTCDAENADDSLFCTQCGAMLEPSPAGPEEPGILYCPQCGAENEEDSIFCTRCGAALASVPAGPEQPDILYCPQCGAENLATAEMCQHCFTDLSDARATLAGPVAGLQLEASAARKRPGCVTAYAILQGIGAISTAIGGVILLGGHAVAEGGILFGVALFSGLVATGLWRLKNWARILLLTLLGLGLATNLLSLLVNFGAVGGVRGGDIVIIIVQLALSFIIFYWFAKHKEYFA